jgi:DNA topoisomerase-1
MDPTTVTLEEALALLSLPRVVGESGGEPITAQNGRYGPYLKKGNDSRSLESESQIFTVTLPEAEAIFAQPKRRGGRTKPPIAELGPHPDSGAPVRVLDGRFGPYVTDGTVNATVPRGVEPAEVTLEQAVDLLREREARGPAKKAAKKSTKAAKTARKATKKTGKKPARTPPSTTTRTVRKGTSKRAAAQKAAAKHTPVPSDFAPSAPADPTD